MELKFENQGTSWVAEFEVAADFNLHIERVSGGRFLVYQKTVKDGEYDLVDGLGYKDHKATIDMDFVALVYPKWIKVVSQSEVTRAVVLPEGVAKPVVAFRTEYDASIYEDRKALWDYLSGFGLQQDESMTLENEIIVTNTVTGTIKVYAISNSFGGSLVLRNNVENLLIHGEDDDYNIIWAE